MFVDGVSRGNRGCKRLDEILAAYRVVCSPVGLPISHRDKISGISLDGGDGLSLPQQ